VSATTATAAPSPAGGSGLVGLTDRIEALGGRLSLRNRQGAGTTVEVTLLLDDRTTTRSR
jgi:signal transduction histidine kinase